MSAIRALSKNVGRAARRRVNSVLLGGHDSIRGDLETSRPRQRQSQGPGNTSPASPCRVSIMERMGCFARFGSSQRHCRPLGIQSKQVDV